MRTNRAEFLAGVRDELPILVGTVPFGLIYGVSALSAHLSAGLVQGMSAIIFAGSAQFIAAQLLGAGVPIVIVMITGLIVNLRHMLYSASIAPYVKHLRPAWRWFLAYLLTDEVYAVAITHYRRPGDETNRHWYFLGAGVALWASWQASTALGVFLGAQVPASWSLDFTLALTFIALVVPAITDRASVAAALTAGVLAISLAHLPYKLGLIAATLGGIAVGLLLEARRRSA
jgi:4-azaleucine resistance transporter AzlC